MTSIEANTQYLHGGDVLVCSTPTKLTTILGSCISVCLYDPKKRIGGMNHFLFPLPNEGEKENKKTGQFAMNALLVDMKLLGSIPWDLQAKVYGGARLTNGTTSVFSSGKANLEYAQKFLAERDIPIISQDTGGSWGRKIQFDTDSGVVLVNYLKH